jgi:hypothetical protein
VKIGVLQIGGGIVLNERDIIGVFNFCAENRALIDDAAKQGVLRNISEGFRSFVLAQKKGKTLVYCSKLSGRNMVKRALINNFLEEGNG